MLFPNTKAPGTTDYDWEKSGDSNPVHKVNNIKSGIHYEDEGSAVRYYYCAKASRSEREGNPHPTVKPLKLMEYLVKMIKQPQTESCSRSIRRIRFNPDRMRSTWDTCDRD